ncbi:unnamed protein product [Arabidopsis halleri]
MASSNDSAPENNNVSVVVRQPLHPPTPFFFPHTLSPRTYYFSAPPQIYFISDINFPQPPSIWVYYPLWSFNPSRYESIQELPQLYSPTPSQELTLPPTSSRRVFGRRSHGRCEKVTWRRCIKPEVESNGDHITTVMLCNIPNRYTREMMIEYMDKHCEEANKSGKNEEFTISAYDFIYLPIDFRTTMNKGYAFVNFANAEAVSKFKAACNHKPWCHFHSKKELEITFARIQANELVKRFQQMTYPAEAYSALCFSPARDGGDNTVQTSMVGKCTELVSSV